jgi:putative PIN family toxin of toxin-antitoxin system
MRLRAVVDTNVVVGGLLTADPASPLVQIVDGMLAGRFPFLLSPPLVAEYRAVLLRPKLCSLHGLSGEEIEAVLVELAANGIWREPAPHGTNPGAPDPGDEHLWDLLCTADASVLVTGDQLLLEQPPAFASVISPRSFVEIAGE